MRQYSEAAAEVWAKRILDKAELTGVFPMSFRQVPEVGHESIREAFADPYRIWFRIHRDEVEILVVFHGSRQVPD